EDLHVLAAARDDAIGEGMRAIVEEEVLDDIGLIAEAEDKIRMAVVAVPLHHVSQDRLVAERYHGLRNGFGIFSDTGSKTTAEENDLHDAISLGSIIVTVGMAMTNFAPQEPTWLIWRTISSFRFQGRMKT